MSSEVLHLRISKAEGEMLKKTAGALGITRSELIRKITYSFARLDGRFWESLQHVSEQTGLNDTAVLEALVYDCLSDLTMGKHNTPEALEAKAQHVGWINRIVRSVRTKTDKSPSEAINRAKTKRAQ